MGGGEHVSIAENLEEAARRKAEHLEHARTPEPEISEEIQAEALEIVAGLNGKAVNFGNVEAYLEGRTGGFVPPKAVKRVLNVLGALGWITDKNCILTMPEGVAR